MPFTNRQKRRVRNSRSRTGRTVPGFRINWFRPCLEFLEDRMAPAVFTVNTTADTVAARYKISREAQDEYSLQSQMRTAAGQ